MGQPCLQIPQEKVARGKAQIDYVLWPTPRHLCHLAVAAIVGTLQSLIPAIPIAVGTSYLTTAYQCILTLSIMDFGGSHALFYASPVDLSPECKGKAGEMVVEPVSVILWNGVTPIQGLYWKWTCGWGSGLQWYIISPQIGKNSGLWLLQLSASLTRIYHITLSCTSLTTLLHIILSKKKLLLPQIYAISFNVSNYTKCNTTAVLKLFTSLGPQWFIKGLMALARVYG